MKIDDNEADRWDAGRWQAPDGLGYSSLRPVRLTGAGRALQVCALAMLLGGMAAGFFLNRESLRQNTEARLLADQGVRHHGADHARLAHRRQRQESQLRSAQSRGLFVRTYRG